MIYDQRGDYIINVRPKESRRHKNFDFENKQKTILLKKNVNIITQRQT